MKVSIKHIFTMGLVPRDQMAFDCVGNINGKVMNLIDFVFNICHVLKCFFDNDDEKKAIEFHNPHLRTLTRKVSVGKESG